MLGTRDTRPAPHGPFPACDLRELDGRMAGMTTPVSAERRDGLRERKKAKTRQTIQEQALRLFVEQGYDETTVEQIAEAAEVSPSTFFRYFPTKEALVLRDDYAAVLHAALAAQPADAPLGTVLRDTFRTAFARLSQEEQSDLRLRARLQMSIPSLRARTLDKLLSTVDGLAAELARRFGRDPDDLRMRTLCGAVAGALVPVLVAWVTEDGGRPLDEMVDEALANLSCVLGG